MKKEISGKRFIKKFLLLFFTFALVTSILTFILDPLSYFRDSKIKTYYSESFSTAGILKNSDAEIAIVGSSMVQNTDIDLVEDIFGKEAVKYTRSGMSVDEIIMLLNKSTSTETNKVSKYIVNIDMTTFNTEKESPYKKYPDYLYDGSRINDIKYLLGFETWTKFVPFNLTYNIAEDFKNPLSSKVVEEFARTTDIDQMGDWSNGTQFGKEIVKVKYNNDVESVSEQNKVQMTERMIKRLEEDFVPVIERNKDKEFILVFPPYSALMWYDAEKKGYMDELVSFKSVFVSEFTQMDNVTIFDFQDYQGITDLNNYKDTTHYRPEFNDMMINMIAENESVINNDNTEVKIKKLKSLLQQFKKENSEWITQDI
ncbi:hypothetical protein [Robertmurraya sp.]|uniref:hypothetical protein n=1 Tax=Robertmurraya sp. TaxID=2837525 RepID=UPI003704CDF1